MKEEWQKIRPRRGPATRVLLGHRNDLQRTRMLTALGEDNHHIFAANNGLVLLEWVADALLSDVEPPRPNVIVAEIDLPKRRGIDLLADLRSVGWTTPFLLTARPENHDLIEVARKFESVFVFKEPYDLYDLRTAVLILLRAEAKAAAQASRPSGLAERRSSVRVPVHLWAEEPRPEGLSLLQVANISKDGLRIRHRVALQQGSVCRLKFQLPGDPRAIVLLGKVVNVKPEAREYGMGVQFLNLRIRDRKRISRFVRGRGTALSAAVAATTGPV